MKQKYALYIPPMSMNSQDKTYLVSMLQNGVILSMNLTKKGIRIVGHDKQKMQKFITDLFIND